MVQNVEHFIFVLEFQMFRVSNISKKNLEFQRGLRLGTLLYGQCLWRPCDVLEWRVEKG